MIDRGELGHVRVGRRRVRIKRSDFDALVEGSYIGTMSPPSEGIWSGVVPVPEARVESGE